MTKPSVEKVGKDAAIEWGGKFNAVTLGVTITATSGCNVENLGWRAIRFGESGEIPNGIICKQMRLS
jgi:hypothetical protein